MYRGLLGRAGSVRRRWSVCLVAGGSWAALCGAVPAVADATTAGVTAPEYTFTAKVAPGVTFRTFATSGIGGPALGDLMTIDLRDPRVEVGLLRPPVVAARRTVSSMANARHAVGGVNGDFFNIGFNIGNTQPGVEATGSPVGPEVDDGRPLKAAVPAGQRFGPELPPATTTEDVIGVGEDERAHVARLTLQGTIRSRKATLPLRGLNQYALPVGGAGAFTSDWGGVSRRRAVCGSDTDRDDPCSTDTAEVTVRRGAVVKVEEAVGAGAIPPDTTVLVGREKAAGALRTLRPGDRVSVRYRFTGPERFRFALGGFPILRDGVPLDGLDTRRPAPRTAAGVGGDGRYLYLVVVDGRSARSGGLTVAELAGLLDRAGADDAVNLDGGGSSTFVARLPGEPSATVRNVPSDGTERAVANGIGVFTRR
ncbi:hypothetical protein Acsp03_02950 [Actinomadura sp. NBRC 104412]|nr:hypothetical protein Acsp03_02950 [Actinomadura sp. NBRC 104412]